MLPLEIAKKILSYETGQTMDGPNGKELADMAAALTAAFEIIDDLSQGNRMSETTGTLLRRFEILRERAVGFLIMHGGK